MWGIFVGATLAVGVIYSVGMVSLRQEGVFSQNQEIDEITVSAIATDNRLRFKVHSSEQDNSCSLMIETNAGDPDAIISGADCDTIHPGLAAARWWNERPDKSVAILDAKGAVIAELAIADGAAFESYNPRLPILTFFSAR